MTQLLTVIECQSDVPFEFINNFLSIFLFVVNSAFFSPENLQMCNIGSDLGDKNEV